MAKQQTDFNVDQGSDFEFDVTLLDDNDDPVDVSTSLIIGHIRKNISSKDILAEFQFIPIDLTAGKFTLFLDAITTSQFPCGLANSPFRTITQFAYDVEVHDQDGRVTRILEGVLNVSPGVTR